MLVTSLIIDWSKNYVFTFVIWLVIVIDGQTKLANLIHAYRVGATYNPPYMLNFAARCRSMSLMPDGSSDCCMTLLSGQVIEYMATPRTSPWLLAFSILDHILRTTEGNLDFSWNGTYIDKTEPSVVEFFQTSEDPTYRDESVKASSTRRLWIRDVRDWHHKTTRR